MVEILKMSLFTATTNAYLNVLVQLVKGARWDKSKMKLIQIAHKLVNVDHILSLETEVTTTQENTGRCIVTLSNDDKISIDSDNFAKLLKVLQAN